ncbi:MAG: glycosyltransferase [Candidatus Nanopelagicales bacterium]|jgi:cellulose synthase/poly-beta-1,6-N-acetylglucosamine synthase-like glycosyltransferase|nr:glycosyltransferase [Candidatus Nanopelagicales bacterium]
MGYLDWLLFSAYYISLVAILIGYIWTVVLYIAGNAYLRRWRDAPPGDESAFLWVFLVPALNEGVTIADSVARLRSVQATHKIIMVINDGSEDNTAEVLDRIAGEDLEVLTRVAPNARTGKAAALNAAFHHVRENILQKVQYRNFAPDKIIFGIVDADGRLAEDAPPAVSRHFEDSRVGGVQVHVHIYNQSSWLTRMQGLEFQIFGGLFQVGRSRWGTAFLGGNGQFNRMTALESVADDEGPWSHYLTEDQELGLRCLEAGWRGEHEPSTSVAQQGLNDLKRLYRQRARWFQGNLQVIRDVGRLNSYDLYGVRRLDTAISLILPALQMIVGLALLQALILSVFFDVPYLPWGSPLLVVFFIQLSVGPTFLGVMVVGRGHGPAGIARALATAVPYLVYTWIMWPVVAIGVWKQVRGSTTWAKTERETVAVAAVP